MWDAINAHYQSNVVAKWVELYDSNGILIGLRNGTVDMVYPERKQIIL
jgi:hypothetical protein